MVRTNDGFEISEADLQLRGPGDMEGTQQSGIAFDLKIANIAKDGQILQLARDIANEILDKDPELSPDRKLCPEPPITKNIQKENQLESDQLKACPNLYFLNCSNMLQNIF